MGDMVVGDMAGPAGASTTARRLLGAAQATSEPGARAQTGPAGSGDSVQPLHPYVLVPILLIGGGLALIQALTGPRASLWSGPVQGASFVVTWSIAVWVLRRGVSRHAMFVMVVWADVAITAGAVTMGSVSGLMVSLAMLALPSGVIALYGSRPMLAVQAIGVLIGSVVMLRLVHLPPLQLAVQSAATVLATMSPALGVAMLRARLLRALDRERHSALTDPLTGLLNRRGLELAASALLLQAARSGLVVGVAVVDVDHFKEVNDRHGHSAGDQVLRHVASCLTEVTRSGDMACRLGGEEFVLLYACSPDQVSVVAERLRVAVSSEPAHTVTVSIGATWLTPSGVRSPLDLDDVWAVIDHADALLFQAKRDGRNRVSLAPSPQVEEDHTLRASAPARGLHREAVPPIG